jgi:hypothetical protein
VAEAVRPHEEVVGAADDVDAVAERGAGDRVSGGQRPRLVVADEQLRAGTWSPFSSRGSNVSVVSGPRGFWKLGIGSESLFVLLDAPTPKPRLAKTCHIALTWARRTASGPRRGRRRARRACEP